MGFPRTLRPQLDEIIIALAIRYQPKKLEHLVPSPQKFGIKPKALDQQIDPLGGGKMTPGLHIGVEIKMGKLNGLEVVHNPRRDSRIFRKSIFEIRNAPDTAHQKPGVPLHRIRLHHHSLDAQIGELGLINSSAIVESHGNLVDDPMMPFLLDKGLHQPCLVPMNVMLAQNFPHRLHPGSDARLVMGGAILPQKILQHVGGHHRIALHDLHQVLPNHQPLEMGIDLGIQRRHSGPP